MERATHGRNNYSGMYNGLPHNNCSCWTALHLRSAEFKFTHNILICNRLADTEPIFGIDIQKKFSISYAWDKEKNCYIQKEGNS